MLDDSTRYVWIGIDADNQLFSIRSRVSEIKKQYNTADSGITPPFHISLKMPFQLSDSVNEITQSLYSFFSNLKSFAIPVKGYEYHENIVWIKMNESDVLNRISDDLNAMLLTRYGIGLHQYDGDHCFHVTLFMDGDAEKVKKCYDSILDETLPDVIIAERFMVGISNSGEPGSYHVIREFTSET